MRSHAVNRKLCVMVYDDTGQAKSEWLALLYWLDRPGVVILLRTALGLSGHGGY